MPSGEEREGGREGTCSVRVLAGDFHGHLQVGREGWGVMEREKGMGTHAQVLMPLGGVRRRGCS